MPALFARARLYLAMVCRWGSPVISEIGIPAIWNFRVTVVTGAAGAGAQLPAQEQHNPDHKRGGDDQRRSQCCQVGEHGDPFLLGSGDATLPLAIVSHRAHRTKLSPRTGRGTPHTGRGHGKI
jgi:hypothetical protein